MSCRSAWASPIFWNTWCLRAASVWPPVSWTGPLKDGGVTNAATSQDYTHYYITVAAADLADTLPYLAEVVLRAGIPEQEFERERQVVLEEIRRAADNPDYTAYQLLMETAYGEHPYGRPVLGTPESLMQLTPELLRAYHRGWYRPESMTVVVTGGLEPEKALALVEEQFGGSAAGPAAVSPHSAAASSPRDPAPGEHPCPLGASPPEIGLAHRRH